MEINNINKLEITFSGKEIETVKTLFKALDRILNKPGFKHPLTNEDTDIVALVKDFNKKLKGKDEKKEK